MLCFLCKLFFNPDKFYFFNSLEIPEFKGFSWHKQINESKGFYLRGNHFVVEFDGKGNFKLIRPDKKEWFSC